MDQVHGLQRTHIPCIAAEKPKKAAAAASA
jgi:hypothetical protein